MCNNIQRKIYKVKPSTKPRLAGVTRLELAASGVTGRRSNQTELHPPEIATLLYATPLWLSTSLKIWATGITSKIGGR
ncbi:uncharacterized protein METZ01_LOCUS431300 [marine metagenome]|uniref:Uncharacterized protein n=1 Tax=marine metagenome TaxID=408172 RepID=A0A382Y565_9ZZZZ